MLELTKDMLLGIPQIDEQHRELVRMLNATQSSGFGKSSAAEIQKALDFLGSYIVKHFTDEEVLQMKSRYPKFEWHKEQHKAFIEDFKKLRQEFMANGVSAKFTLTLNQKVIGWVVRHIQQVDIEFGKFYQAQMK